MGMWWSSNQCNTPICASPSAPPPSSATPIFSRDLEDGLVSVALAGVDDETGLASLPGVSCARQKERNNKEQMSACRVPRMKSSLQMDRRERSWPIATSFAQCAGSHKELQAELA